MFLAARLRALVGGDTGLKGQAFLSISAFPWTLSMTQFGVFDKVESSP